LVSLAPADLKKEGSIYDLPIALERAADEVEEYETLRSIEQSLEVKLKDISLALEKIEKGIMEFVKNAEAEIEIERLEAILRQGFVKIARDN
jgi:RNA polymerase-binding transcription factor DksA